MKVARRKNWTAAARQAAARKTKRKISKARKASRKAALGAVPKARRNAARKRKRGTPRRAPKAKARTKDPILTAVAGVVARGRMGPRYADILTRRSLRSDGTGANRQESSSRICLVSR